MQGFEHGSEWDNGGGLGMRCSRHLVARVMDELSRWEVTLGRMAELEGTGV